MQTRLPDPRTLSPAALARFQKRARTCTGPCGRVLTVADFEMTTAGNKPMLRGQCRDCLKAYYRSDTVKVRRMKARGAKLLFEVVENGSVWEVRRIVLDERRADGAYSLLFSTHESEQEAEAKVLGIYQEIEGKEKSR